MRPVEKKRFRVQLVLGMILTLATVAADWAGILDPFEHVLYDRRCRHCQFFLRPPAPVVHLDIDGNAIDVLGRPPWPRSTMAAIVNALYEAEARVVSLDILFSDADPMGPQEDRQLAQAFSRGISVAAVLLNTASDEGANADLRRRLREQLWENLDLDADVARARLAGEGFDFGRPHGDFNSEFLGVRKEVMLERIDAALEAGTEDPALIFDQISPGLPRDKVADSDPLVRLFDQQLDLAQRLREMRRFFRTPQAHDPVPSQGANRTPLILPLARAAAGSGFVNYDPDTGGVVRAVPLWIAVDGKMLPQLGLATLCAFANVRLEDVQLSPDAVIIPRKAPDAAIVIPVHKHDYRRDKGVAYSMNVPMFGKADQWESMYDFPLHQASASHISVLGAYRITNTRDRIQRNQAVVDQALAAVFNVIDPEVAANYALLSPEVRPRDDMMRLALEEIPTHLKAYEEITDLPPELVQTIKRLKAGQEAIAAFPAADRQLRGLLQEQLASLAERVKGRAVFIGFAAEGADLVTTPLHERCPGVVVHGAVFSAAMSGELWKAVPFGYTAAITIVLGSLTTLLVAHLSPARGMIVAVLILLAYAAINGILVFDYGNLVVGAAAPITAIAVVWAALTLLRVISEIGERNRITRRFQSYVDPRLVRYVIEHPELVRLEGEVRELTIVFTDLVGFTSLTEQLGPRAVKVLSLYKSKMVPVIRRHGGLIHCFMGDGIMFSYGAPEANPNHAVDAVATVLELFEALEEFNQEIIAEGYAPLGMRAGVSTGKVVVGDSGGDDGCDYTALGDPTNLGARLESANKMFGTRTLLSGRTTELLEDRFLLRPIGRLVVAGKRQSVMTFEALGRTELATDEQRELAALTSEMVEHFVAARFESCLAAAVRIEERFGASQLTTLYRENCRRHLADPPAEFAGEIVLKEK